MTRAQRTIHPFPARMAPDVALEKIESLTDEGAVVLDPMCGSGTVPRIAIDKGRRAIATDLDPLAVKITRTACTVRWSKDLGKRASELVTHAKKLSTELPPWIASDEASTTFVNYWFADQQRRQLSQLAKRLFDAPQTDDPLRVALSRLIITKEGGASLARDTSHSRPHRVRTTNDDYDVFREFVRAAERIEKLMSQVQATGSASVRTVDARKLPFVQTGSIDLVVTSPPYLNAIDYLRGHRMSLVWLGERITELRERRGTSIGSERGLTEARPALRDLVEQAVPQLDELSRRDQKIVYRFAEDMTSLCQSLARVVKPGAHLVCVVADSQLRGIPVSNSAIFRRAAANRFTFIDGTIRTLPSQHRYLPPPTCDGTALGARMREEVVLTFRKSAS